MYNIFYFVIRVSFCYSMSITLKLFSNKLKKKIYLMGIAIKIDRKKGQCIDRWKDNQTGERESKMGGKEGRENQSCLLREIVI